MNQAGKSQNHDATTGLLTVERAADYLQLSTSSIRSSIRAMNRPPLLLIVWVCLVTFTPLPAGRAQTSPDAVSITVESGARQTFQGLGASLFPWTPSPVYNAQVTTAQTRLMARLLWRDAHFRSVRLWIHPGEESVEFYVDGYVRTGKLPAAIAAGAKDFILAPDHIPPAMGDGKGFLRDEAIPRYAALLAEFIRAFKDKTGILINYCGVLNEPNDRPVKPSDAQWPPLIKALRQALDSRGLKSVNIVAPESANCGADAYAVVDAIRGDPAAWQSLNAVATHSYNNAATEDMARRALGGNKSYWMTEASDNGPESPRRHAAGGLACLPLFE